MMPLHGGREGRRDDKREFGRCAILVRLTDFSARRAQADDESRRFPAAKGNVFSPMPVPRTRRGEERSARRDTSDASGMTWRRADGERESARGLPAWLADDTSARAPPTSKGVDTIEEFKAQMREMERRERGEPSEPLSQPSQRNMFEDFAQEEPEGTSRFARFFGSKSESKQTDGASSPSIESLDLFGMITKRRANTPGTPTLPDVGGHASGAVSSTASPQIASTPHSGHAEPAVSTSTDTPPETKPSAKDMASMQMLMAKLMSGSRSGAAASPSMSSGHSPVVPSGPPGLGSVPPPPGLASNPPPGLAANPPPGIAANPPPGLASNPPPGLSPSTGVPPVFSGRGTPRMPLSTPPPGLRTPATESAAGPDNESVARAAPMDSLAFLQSLMNQGLRGEKSAPNAPRAPGAPPPGFMSYAPPPHLYAPWPYGNSHGLPPMPAPNDPRVPLPAPGNTTGPTAPGPWFPGAAGARPS